MSKSDSIRQEVSRNYAAAIRSSDGCCGGSCQVSEPRDVVAQWAGYTEQEMTGLGQGSSFGCGNPVSFAEVRTGEVVLDLGSGAGLDLLIAGARVGAAGRVIGVDMTDEMLEVARRNIARSGLSNVEVRRGIIEALPVEDSSVDWVISNCVINLSPEKHRVFEEISRVLRPGGKISISDIVAQDLPQLVRDNPALYSGCLGGAISEAEYVEGLRRAGLENVEVRQRTVYTREQLLTFGASLSELLPEGSGELASALTGKVWSAQFSARKPA
ncbi:MAG: arsenite methyltransferase [Armatimonadetes bacterium]|nr:arsenite methyltransferase [Armatimonadota bacterium]